MLVPKNVFCISKACDTESSRYALGGVLVERDPEGNPVAVATDGRRLAVVSWTEDDGAEYPVDGGDAESVDGFSTIIDKSHWDEAGKAARKVAKSSKPILRNVLLEESANGKVSLSTFDLESRRAIATRPIEGKFPKWREAIPENRPEVNHRHFLPDSEIDDRISAHMAKDYRSPEDRDEFERLQVVKAGRYLWAMGRCRVRGSCTKFQRSPMLLAMWPS